MPFIDRSMEWIPGPQAFDARMGPLRPWFLRMVRNLWLDLLRKRLSEAAPAQELPDPADSPERRAEAAQPSC